MTRRADIAVAAGFALAGAVVIVAPAVAMRWGVLQDGVGSLDVDILAASAAVAAFNTSVSWERLLYEERAARERLHVWIASLNALVALALGATALLVFVLLFFPDEHASLADRGYPVIILWAATQLVAVFLAEATARLCFRYLEPAAPRPPRPSGLGMVGERGGARLAGEAGRPGQVADGVVPAGQQEEVE